MKTATVFQNRRRQAVRFPKEFHLPGDEVFIRKIGNTLVLIPKDNPWQSLLDSVNQFSPDFMETRNQPKQQIRTKLKTARKNYNL